MSLNDVNPFLFYVESKKCEFVGTSSSYGHP